MVPTGKGAVKTGPVAAALYHVGRGTCTSLGQPLGLLRKLGRRDAPLDTYGYGYLP